MAARVRAVWVASCLTQLCMQPSLPSFFTHFLLEASGRRVVSHEVVLGGKLAAKTSFSLSRPSSPRVEDLKGEWAPALPGPPPCPGALPALARLCGLTAAVRRGCPLQPPQGLPAHPRAAAGERLPFSPPRAARGRRHPHSRGEEAQGP